ncbi:hypothetical protein F4679DRAFT_578539 [Xylaria curta]|nr:hypothetical protein F4679DRAFT_578539 [Xylaria curta]
MAPFTLSIPGYRLGVHSYKQRHHDTTRSPSPYAESDAETQFSSTRSRLPSETINPLSHSPNTLRQLAVAGLSPQDELPSRTHPNFPHKPLRVPRKRRDGRTTPSRRVVVRSDSGVETDSTFTSQQESRREIGDVRDEHHSARMRHLNTMTAIMHRCLRDGDIVRAKRALGLLMRTRDVDVRVDNLWAIGLEILMRDGEQEEEEVKVAAKRPSSPSISSSSDTDSDSDIADGEGRGGDEGSTKGNPQSPQRWGSAANIAQVKQYLETLIQHHPYDAHRPQLTSAIDFWPALFGIEIYNLDAEFQSSLHHIHLEHGFPSSSSSFSRSASPSPDREHDDYEADRMDLDDDNEEMKLRRRSDREEEQDRERHNATDALRSESQLGALGLATRMDGVLENPPYSTHAELLRLRGHVALFIADLYLPSRLMERYAKREEEGQRRLSLRDVERRLRQHARHSDEHVALARRREEQARATVFFRRAVAAKGRLEVWVLRFLDEEDEEEEHD